MNRRFYRALMLSSAFFHTFRNVRYHGVPVARAMFYSFHRRVMLGSKKGIGKRKMKISKKRLYNWMIRSDKVTPVPYRKPKQRGKIIFSPEAASGLPISRTTSLICAVGKHDRKKERRAPVAVPSQMVGLNYKQYAALRRKIIAIARKKSTPAYFRNKLFIKWMLKELKTVMKTIDGIRRLFANHSIRAIVLHSSVHPLGYLLVHMGRQRGIPTIILQYGLNDHYQLFSTYARYYVAWGPFHKKRLTQYGVPSRKIVTLGNARFDPIFKKKWVNKRKLARILRISRRKWLFVYPEQPLPLKKNRKVLRMLIKALQPYRRKVMLLVKPHPRQRKLSFPRRRLKRYRFIRVVRHPHLYHLIHGSNAVFVQFSTVGVEAILMNRPVIALVMFKNTVKHEHTYYSASRHITSAKGQKQLNKIVRRFVLSSRFRKNMLLKQRYYRKGTYSGKLAARRIYNFIKARCR